MLPDPSLTLHLDMPDPLTDVLVALDAARQRATCGTVAGHLGVPAMFLMNGRPRDPLHS